MLKHLDEAYRVLNTLYQTSGIGAICYDAQLNVAGCRPTKTVANDFLCLGTGGLTHFLSEKLEQPPGDDNVCYTYFLEGNLACLILLIAQDEAYLGAFVTQPVFLKTLSPEEAEVLLEKLNVLPGNRDAMKGVLKRVPVRSFETLRSVGEALSNIANGIFSGNTINHIFCGEKNKETENGYYDTETSIILDEAFPVRQLRFADYLMLKEGIQSGNAADIEKVAMEIANGSMPTHQLDRKNYIRSLKDSYIKVCSMACYAAVEANAPYYKLLDLADEHIRQMEKLENAFEIFELMKTTLFDFAHSVRVSRIQTHSKAVRQVLDYIDAHFDEKITLEMLAEYTQLSTFYLSSLIKKETGLILTDNVNAVRVEKSKKLLFDKSLNIIDVAHQVGFSYQNHFSTVFKKFTGMTPSEYVKAMGSAFESKEPETQGNKTVDIIFEQLRKTLSVLPEMFDAARVVDPRNNKAWAVKNNSEDTMSETCYAFWKKEGKCKNCVAQKAFLNNRATFKLDKKGGSTFFVVAIPKTIGKDTYILELLKMVSSDLLVDTGTEGSAGSSMGLDYSLPSDAYTGIFGVRKELEANLHLSVRISKLENKPFSVIVSLCEDYADTNSFSAADVQQIVLNRHAQAQGAEVAPDHCFAGNYTGDIMLLALGGTDYPEACRIAEAIENDFENMAFSPDGQARFFKFYSGVKTLTDDIADADELINLALMDLNTKIGDRQLN